MPKYLDTATGPTSITGTHHLWKETFNLILNTSAADPEPLVEAESYRNKALSLIPTLQIRRCTIY
jgi:hypothetical protein